MFDWTKYSTDPNDEAMRSAWLKWYESNVVRFDMFSTRTRDERVLEELCGLDAHQPPKKILDVGFAEHGVEYAKLPDWFHRKLRVDTRNFVAGLDLNEPAVAEIRRYTGFDNLFAGDATDEQSIIAGGDFDVIHAGDLIEHVSNTLGFLKFCRQNLKIGGRIVITTPNPVCQKNITYFQNFGILANMEHTCWITPTNMNELCRRSNLHFLESHYKMEKKRNLKNKLREHKIRKHKDLHFGEFMYVIERRS